jgi:hypothetical protein
VYKDIDPRGVGFISPHPFEPSEIVKLEFPHYGERTARIVNVTQAANGRYRVGGTFVEQDSGN